MKAPRADALDPGATVRRWGADLPVEPGIQAEIRRFTNDGETLGQTYAAALAQGIKKQVFEAAAKNLAQIDAGKMEPFFDVTFPDPGFATGQSEKELSDAQKKFESGFVRTEFRTFVACDDTPRDALRIYTSEAFRLKTSSRTKRIWIDGGNSCVETEGKMFVPAMMSCNHIDELHEPGMSLQHSQVVSNPGGRDYQVVYFKESLKTITKVDGGLIVHYINFSRSMKINSIAKKFVKGALQDSQLEAIAELHKELEAISPEHSPQ